MVKHFGPSQVISSNQSANSITNQSSSLNYFQRQNALCAIIILISYFNVTESMFPDDLELNFIDRIYMTIRASCFASIPLLGNMFVIPILILIVEKFQRSKNIIEDKYHYQKFLDVNIQLIRDHFHMLLLFEINLFGIAVLNNNQIDNF